MCHTPHQLGHHKITISVIRQSPESVQEEQQWVSGIYKLTLGDWRCIFIPAQVYYLCMHSCAVFFPEMDINLRKGPAEASKKPCSCPASSDGQRQNSWQTGKTVPNEGLLPWRPVWNLAWLLFDYVFLKKNKKQNREDFSETTLMWLCKGLSFLTLLVRKDFLFTAVLAWPSCGKRWTNPSEPQCLPHFAQHGHRGKDRDLEVLSGRKAAPILQPWACVWSVTVCLPL